MTQLHRRPPNSQASCSEAGFLLVGPGGLHGCPGWGCMCRSQLRLWELVGPTPLQCPRTSQVRFITSPAPDAPWGPHRCPQGDGHANGAAAKSVTVKGPNRDSWVRGMGSSNQPGLGCLAKITLSLVLKGGQRDKERKGDPGIAWAEAGGLMLEHLPAQPWSPGVHRVKPGLLWDCQP